MPRARVVAICSSTPEEVQWAKDNGEYNEFGIAVYDKYEDMLEHSGLQAVWISTSTDVHAIQSLSAIDKGLHVLCEKPLSTDLDEVQSSQDILSFTYTMAGTICGRCSKEIAETEGHGWLLTPI